MNLAEVYEYYSREDIQGTLFESGKNREVVGVFKSGGYSQRPNALVYPKDILAMVKTGVIEFHSSIERWENPMALKSENYNELRAGWDLILDIDCELFEHGKIAAEIFAWGLKKHGIKNIHIKFTGGTGFHIGVPWESLPKELNYRKTVGLFPELAKNIALYIKEFVKGELEKAFLKKYHIEDLANQVNKPLGKLLVGNALDPYQVVDLDPILISPRHLFRMAYSLHKNTGLVSMPVNAKDLGEFSKEHAEPDAVRVKEKFLVYGEKGEGDLLVAESADWSSKREKLEKKKIRREVRLTKAMPLELAPPCIHNILRGLTDGRKRSIFILINYLSSLKWNWNDIENVILEWNQKNKPPLRESYIRGQLRWHKDKSPKPPPNCVSEGWYIHFGVCTPDSTCGGMARTIKNPVNYPFKKMGEKFKSKR